MFRSFLKALHLAAKYDSINELVRWIRNIARGALEFSRTGNTPEDAYQSLILLFCKTRGKSNDRLHDIVRLSNPPFRLPHPSGLLGDLGRGGARRLADELREKGYFVFPRPMPPETVAALTHYARTSPSAPRPLPPNGPKKTIFDGGAPVAPRYDFSEAELMGFSAVQEIVTDLSLLAVAQEYLRCAPILDIVTMWWSTAFQKEASDISGQRFHFDMDRIKWLKFFFYLTDVTVDSGPTCFIEGSHRSMSQPRELLEMGYSRISDEDMRRHYPEKAFVELTCPKGTIVAVDTRGFHKGKPLESGERLVLQLEYADSLFGGRYEQPTIAITRGSRLDEMAGRYERLFSKFELVHAEPLSRTAESR